jgi:hypothetical protein
MNLSERFSYLLPAFPPKDFDHEAFIVTVIESELKTLKQVREVLKDYLHEVPSRVKLLPERIKYLLDN